MARIVLDQTPPGARGTAADGSVAPRRTPNAEVDVLSVSMEYNGRNDAVKDRMERFAERLRETLGELRCPRHGEFARVRVRWKDPDERLVTYRTCCEQMGEFVAVRLDDASVDADREEDGAGEGEAGASPTPAAGERGTEGRRTGGSGEREPGAGSSEEPGRSPGGR